MINGLTNIGCWHRTTNMGVWQFPSLISEFSASVQISKRLIISGITNIVRFGGVITIAGAFRATDVANVLALSGSIAIGPALEGSVQAHE